MCSMTERDKIIDKLVSNEVRRMRGKINNYVRYIHGEKEQSSQSRLQLDRVKSVIRDYESEIAESKRIIEILES